MVILVWGRKNLWKELSKDSDGAEFLLLMEDNFEKAVNASDKWVSDTLVFFKEGGGFVGE